MTRGEKTAEERHWRGEARKLAWRFNSGWWFDRANRLLVPILLLLSVVILLVRSEPNPPESGQIFLFIGAGLLLTGLLAGYFWSRSRFVGEKQTLVRLDDRLSLRGRLSTAAAGVGAWPEEAAVSSLESAYPKWRPVSILLPIPAALVAAAVAWWIPLPERQFVPGEIVNEPEAWERMEEWIDALEEEELIDPESLREVEEKIAELRDQPKEEWFSHSSLEATDTLEETVGRNLTELGKELATMERDLEALRSFSTELSEAGKEMLMQEYEEALKNLQANGLEMNEALAQQLEGVDLSQLTEEMTGGMSEEALKQLQKQLQQGNQALGSLEGLPSMESDPSMLAMKPGDMPGRGDISRGRGDAPLFYGDETDLKTNQLEGVKNDDPSRARVGDMLGVGETEHDIDETTSGPVAGGEVSSAGKGGDAVWRESLVPSEQSVLKRYFD